MLLLVHHADAVPPDMDPQRPLSDAGREQVRRLTARARERGVKPDAVWHSGKLRARQTAEPIWLACNPLAEFSAVRGLQPGDPPEWIRDRVDTDGRELLVVGHMPHLDRLLAHLCGSSGSGSFPLHGMVALERGAAVWMEIWREGGSE
jgi:phosphohistidine phosphatase